MSKHRLIRGRIAVACVIAASGVPPLLMTQAVAAQVQEPAPAQARPSAIAFDIPAQNLNAALIEFGRQSGQELLYDVNDTTGKTSAAVRGTLTRAEAMRLLLEGTGLDFDVTESGGMVVDDAAAVEGRRAARMRSQLPAAAPAPDAVRNVGAPSVTVARNEGIEEIIVTGQKREERIQDVPIAISAFSMENLDNQKIEGGFDLLKAVPNVTFSKSNFTGYNFQIRGIGTQAISATTDPGVAVSFNNTTLIVNRLFEQEYLDVERVEVLRGPQGTLFGRNATAGVINVISAKPQLGATLGEIKLETGNYGAQRFRGYANLPVGENAAARFAFAATKRDGYGRNLAFSDPDIQDFIRDYNRAPISDNIDNRDLWTGRFSFGWQMTDSLRANFIYERFEEDDRRMRSTKQLCHYHDGNVTLYQDAVEYEDVLDGNGNVIGQSPIGFVKNPFTVRGTIGKATAENIGGGESEHFIQTRYLGQLSQGCLPKSMFDKGDMLSSDPTAQGAYGTPNGNSMPFVRGGRGTAFTYSLSDVPVRPRAYPDCVRTGTALVTNCIADPLLSAHGQSRDMRDIFSLIDPRYQALSELMEASFDYDVSDALTLSSQSVYMENELFSTQDFLRFKTQPILNDSSTSGSGAHGSMYEFKRPVTPKGVFTDPQLGASDRLLMQDVSQQTTQQFSQELRLVSSFDGPLNFSLGANYTQFKNTADYFVFINMLSAFARTGTAYTGLITQNNAGADVLRLLVGCESAIADRWTYENRAIGSCVHVQEGSIDDVRHNPQGHNFFMSRNPFELQSAGAFGELYYELTPALKLTAGLRMNWDRKTFTPTPSQTLLGDWRGRMSSTVVFHTSPQPLQPGDTVWSVCHPRSPNRLHMGGFVNISCALSGLAENGTGYPTLPDLVQEWRTPTGRVGLDWKVDLSLDWVDETLLYAFYTRGYKAGGANPPTQSAPSGLLLEAAQGVSSPPVFEAEYVNAFELGSKNRLFGGAVTVNGTAFYYDYSDYQVSKIVDRTAVNENFDSTVWGLELETVFAPTPDTLFNANIGYLRTRIGDGEKSLDLMNRTQGGNHHYVDPAWATVDCAQQTNASHIACVRRRDNNGNFINRAADGSLVTDGSGEPIYLYRDGFDEWVVVRPTITQASSCVAPAVLIYREVYNHSGGNASLSDDGLSRYCPAGELVAANPFPGGITGYSPFTSAPNGGAGFLADIGGNELPNAPRFTVSLGAQQTFWFPGGQWSATGRVDWYWQDQSYNRVYNTEYDRLQDWTNTNLSFWLSNERMGLTIEAYAKNVFNETPITGAFLNSDDTGLSTNVFTLDPRLIGLSIRKRF